MKESVSLDNSVAIPVKEVSDGEIILLKIKNRNINQSNTISNPKCNAPLPRRLKIVDSNELTIVNDLKINIPIKEGDEKTRNQSNIVSNTQRPLRLKIVDSNEITVVNNFKIDYKDNILLFNSIINEAKLFLASVPEMIKMIPPIVNYRKGSKYCHNMLINRSSQKFGLVFDYSLTNPEDVIHKTSRITTRCMVCTYKQTIRADSHFIGKGCGKCRNKCLWYYEIFIYVSFLIHGDKFIYPIMNCDERLLTEQYLDIICKKCKHIWSSTVSNHIHHKTGCPKCAIEESRWNYDELMEAVIRIHGHKYNYSKVIPSEITSNLCKFIVICNVCDYEWSPSLGHHISHETGCLLCSGNVPWTYFRFLTAAIKIHGDKYYYGLIKSEDIKGKESKVKLWCGKCDHYWNPSITKHINYESGCPKCRISKGEEICLNFFLSNNIYVEKQFRIKELGSKRFDFMIKYNELKYLIEFDGIQHFKFVQFFHKDIKNFITPRN